MKQNVVYRMMSCIWRNTFLKWWRSYKEGRKTKYWMEHRKCFGKENPDKTFYVIRRQECYCGLFSLFLTNLGQIDKAIQNKYIPIIDMQSDFNIYLTADKIGKENAWEYYFKQPCGYSMEDIRKSKNVVFSPGASTLMFPFRDMDFWYGRTGKLEYWRNVVRKYMKLSDAADRIVEEEYKRLFLSGGGVNKILGVKCRGTDYTNGKPKNHPIQPTPEQALAKAEEIFEQQHCTKIFLATEDAAFYRIFADRFGERLIVNKTDYADYQGGSTGREEYERGGGAQAGMEYLVTTMLLARCDCLCAGLVSGTLAALLLTEGYEYMYLFDLGKYT